MTLSAMVEFFDRNAILNGTLNRSIIVSLENNVGQPVYRYTPLTDEQLQEINHYLDVMHDTVFTDKAQSGGGVLIDWGVHFLDLILYILGGAKLKSVTCNAYNEMAKDMKAYKYTNMWAEDTKDIENGTNDVDDFISGYVRTDKANISFTGAWAQNVGINEMYIDFMGDKGGARLDYCKQFRFWSGETLEMTQSDHEIPDMYQKEEEAFFASIDSGVKDKNHIDYVLESARLLEVLYESSERNEEIKL